MVAVTGRMHYRRLVGEPIKSTGSPSMPDRHCSRCSVGTSPGSTASAPTSLKLIAECGDNLSAWPSAKHFTSWLGLAPNNKISGGKVLSSRTKRSGSRAAALLRLAAVTVGRTDTALGAFYRRLSARIGKAKAVTATARKIAVLFYNAVRHGMEYVDPGARVTKHDIGRDSSKTCIGAPKRSASCFNRLSRQPEAPFLRNRFRASAHRSLHAAT